MTMHVKVSGAYKQCAPRVKVDGVYKTVEKGWVKVDGVYKLFYQAGSGVIDLVGTVSTILGNGSTGAFSGSGTSTPLVASPLFIAHGVDGYMYYTSTAEVMYRFDLATLTPEHYAFTRPATTTHVITGAIATAWPGAPSNENAPLLIAPDGTIYISAGYRIFRINSGNLEIVAGAPAATAISSSSGTTDGTGTAARFLSASPFMTWGHDGALYVADGGRAIRKVTTGGVVTTVAGSMTTTGTADATGTAARFFAINGFALATDGNYYISTGSTSNRIRKMTPDFVVTTFKTSFQFVRMVASPDGNLYAWDNYYYKRLALDGTVTDMAGNGTGGLQDGTGTAVRTSATNQLTVAPDGTIYIADSSSVRVRKMV